MRWPIVIGGRCRGPNRSACCKGGAGMAVPGAVPGWSAADPDPAAAATHREPINKERGCSGCIGEIAFEHRHVKGEIVALELRSLQDHDGIYNARSVGTEHRDGGVGRIL